MGRRKESPKHEVTNIVKTGIFGRICGEMAKITQEEKIEVEGLLII